jgi:hypothetical protein
MPTIAERVLAAGTTVVRTHNDQKVANIIHIRLKGSPLQLVVEPDPADLFYTHDRSRGDEMKPHRLVWMAMFKRQAGETLTIRLNRVTHPAKLPLSAPEFAHAFNPKGTPPQVGTWVIESDENAVETFPLDLVSDDLGRVDLKYDVTLAGGTRNVPPLDPGINLIPDP